MTSRTRTHFVISTASIALASAAVAAPDFKRDIAPIFKQHCYECHSEAKGKKKSGYAFDNLQVPGDINDGGIIQPGNANSPIVEYMTSSASAEHHMPPKGQVSERDIKKIKEWIVAGASLDKAEKTAKTDTALPGTKPATAPAAEQEWKNTDGQVIKAALVKLEGDVAVLRMANGKTYRYPLSKLSPESQQQAKGAGL